MPKLPQKYVEANGQLPKSEKHCDRKEIRLQDITISGGQSRHVEENSPIQGALRLYPFDSAIQGFALVTIAARDACSYNMENALKEVDEDYACKSLSKVTPLSYTDSEGNIITYYCCQTTYVSNESGEDTGLNTDAIGMVIDFTQIQNRRDCKVNAYDAFRCEIGEHSYLCWTISPEISCIIEYSADAIDEADIFRMAESVQQPNE